MAKHFKQADDALDVERDVGEGADQGTVVMRARQVSEVPQSVAPDRGTGRLPYGQAAPYRGSYANAAPTREFFLDDMPARGGLPAFGRGVLLLLAWATRLCAFALMVVVLANALSLPIFRQQLSAVTDTITAYAPWHTLGLLAVDTPFGGVFRGDLAILMLLLFVVDWLLCRARARLR